MSHTEIGWIIFAVAVVGSLFSSVPSQPPISTIEPAEQPEEIGSVSVEANDKPSDEPTMFVQSGKRSDCSDGSCGTQRRFRGLLRGRR